jgi:hypothetical protein
MSKTQIMNFMVIRLAAGRQSSSFVADEPMELDRPV